MLIITKKITKILKNKNITQYKLAGLIGYDHGALGHMIRGERPFTDEIIQKIAPILDVSPEQIKGWVIADKYPKNILKMALKVKQEADQQAGILILTVKIDEALKDKGLSRTGLSGVIGYSQGKLNQMIKGDEPISPLVISKIAPVLEVSEEEIVSWVVAGKYSVEALWISLDE